MKRLLNFTFVFVAFSCATTSVAKDPQFRLKNSSDGMIKVKIYKADGKLLDAIDRSAKPGETISIESTGKLSKIDVLYMVNYTAGDTFSFNNVTDSTMYNLNFATTSVQTDAVGTIGANAVATYAEVGELTPQAGSTVSAAQIKRLNR